MIKHLCFLLCLSFLHTKISLAQPAGDPNLGIIPAPVSVKRADGNFIMGAGVLFKTIGVENADLIILAKGMFSQLANQPNKEIDHGTFELRLDKQSNISAEGYQLRIRPQGIQLIARSEQGLFYGLQTLSQLCVQARQRSQIINLPLVDIDDYPRYGYRGMHLDVSRHFFPISFVKKYIDLLAQYKLNTFHWHLTDDQGWRIEIKKYPKLTQIGAYRSQTVIGNYHDRFPQWFDGQPHGGFYSQAEVKEILDYARARFITVIPEIEMPGHSQAALAAYPELACGDQPGPFKVGETWGIIPDVYCAGKENTFQFLEDVLSEVMELFPSTYIHIGGDECPKVKWKSCSYCQKRIRDKKLKNESELQSYFIQRIEKFVNTKGRKVIGWDEILEGGLAPNATVMSWQSIEGGIAASKQNHDAIMTPVSIVYFDHAQGRSDQEPLCIGGNTPLEEVYSYNPTPSKLTPEQQKHIIGVQANVWTEYMPSAAKVEYMLLPRLYALSEIAWSPLSRKDYANFSKHRVPSHLAQLDAGATNYRVPNVIGISDTSMVGAQFHFQLQPSVAGAQVFYTIDGYSPRESDLLYEKPLDIFVLKNEKRVLKALVITPSGKRSAVTTVTMSNLDPFPPIATTNTFTKSGLKYYLVPGEFDTVMAVDTMSATNKGALTSNIKLSAISEKPRTYGLVFRGYIKIPADGLYTFSSLSDDGSRILIDDQTVVDNDGKHASFELAGGVNLEKGYHKFEIRYFQRGGSSTLKIFMTEPGKSKVELPPTVLFIE